MKRLTLALALLLISVLLFPGSTLARHMKSSTHKAFPVTIVDDLHNTVRLTQRPNRIVSLDPRDTETLFALNLESRVVGDGGKDVEGAAGISRDFKPSEWPSSWGRDYPVKAKALPHVEGGFGNTPFDLEKIESLRPDLIISLNSDLPSLQKLRSLGFKVIVLDPANIKGILHDITLVGKATGAVKQAAAVTATMKNEEKATLTKVARVSSHPRVYYEIDATNPTEPFTAGPGTFIDEAIRLAGSRNVADSVTSCSGTTCYPQFSLESLVKLDPQVIVLGDAAYGTTATSVKARAGWETISAVKSGRIYPFDDELISRAGPRIMIGLRQLARLIEPKAFR
jgi:iron complex transport system substrate-binding protein